MSAKYEIRLPTGGVPTLSLRTTSLLGGTPFYRDYHVVLILVLVLILGASAGVVVFRRRNKTPWRVFMAL